MEFTDLEELWFVVILIIRLNHRQLADIRHRMKWLVAVANLSPSMGVCDVEMQLPQPPTIDTLKVLGEVSTKAIYRYHGCRFH